MNCYKEARTKEEILPTIQRRKVNYIGHILRRNCLLKHVIEGKTGGARRRGIRRKQLRDNLRGKKETQGVERSTNCRKADYVMKKSM